MATCYNNNHAISFCVGYVKTNNCKNFTSVLRYNIIEANVNICTSPSTRQKLKVHYGENRDIVRRTFTFIPNIIGITSLDEWKCRVHIYRDLALQCDRRLALCLTSTCLFLLAISLYHNYWMYISVFLRYNFYSLQPLLSLLSVLTPDIIYVWNSIQSQ